MNSKVRPYHIVAPLNNLLDMGFIETMGRPRKKSERKKLHGTPPIGAVEVENYPLRGLF